MGIGRCNLTQTGNFASTSADCIPQANKLYFPNLFQNNTHLGLTTFTITVTNIVNPSPANTYIPVTAIEVSDSSSGQLTQTTSTSSVTIVPQTILCSVSLISNTQVFATGTIQVTYNSNLINSSSSTGYSLSVSMPPYYPDDGTQTLISPSFGQG